VESENWNFDKTWANEGNPWDKPNNTQLKTHLTQGWAALNAKIPNLTSAFVVSPQQYVAVPNPWIYYNNAVDLIGNNCRRYWVEKDGTTTDIGILCWIEGTTPLSLEANWANERMDIVLTYGHSASLEVRGHRFYWLSRTAASGGDGGCSSVSKQIGIMHHFLPSLNTPGNWVNAGDGVENWTWAGGAKACGLPQNITAARDFFGEVRSACNGAKETAVNLSGVCSGRLGGTNTKLKAVNEFKVDTTNENQLLFCNEPIKRLIYINLGTAQALTEDRMPLDQPYIGYCPEGVEVADERVNDYCKNNQEALNCSEF
jgi:hypothetical protein